MTWSVLNFSSYFFKLPFTFKKLLKHPHTVKKWLIFKKYSAYWLVFNYFIKNGNKLKVFRELVSFFILFKILNLSEYWDVSLNFYNILVLFDNFSKPVFFPKIVNKQKVKSSALKKKERKRVFKINIIFCKNYMRSHLIKKLCILLVTYNNKPISFNILFFFYNFLFKKFILNKLIFGVNKRAMNLYY